MVFFRFSVKPWTHPNIILSRNELVKWGECNECNEFIIFPNIFAQLSTCIRTKIFVCHIRQKNVPVSSEWHPFLAIQILWTILKMAFFTKSRCLLSFSRYGQLEFQSLPYFLVILVFRLIFIKVKIPPLKWWKVVAWNNVQKNFTGASIESHYHAIFNFIMLWIESVRMEKRRFCRSKAIWQKNPSLPIRDFCRHIQCSLSAVLCTLLTFPLVYCMFQISLT